MESLKATVVLAAALLFLGLARSEAEVEAEAEKRSHAEQKPVSEEEVRERVKAYVGNVDRQIRALDYFLDTYYQDWNYTEADATEYVSNPINTYMLIKRTGLEWPNVKKVLFNETAEAEAKVLEGMIRALLKQRGEGEGEGLAGAGAASVAKEEL